MGFGSETARREYESRVSAEAAHQKKQIQSAVEHFRSQMPSIIHRIEMKVNDDIRRNGKCVSVRLRMRGKDFVPATWLTGSEGQVFFLNELRAFEPKVANASARHIDRDRCHLIVDFSPAIT